MSKTTTRSNGTMVAKARMSDRAAIRAAGLSYVRSSDLYLRRVRHGRGFRYLDAEGRTVRNRALINRLASLAVPPAYEDVRLEPACSAAGRRRQVMAAVKETADTLANTPAVCRRSYVHDAMVASFENGKLKRLSDKMKGCRTPAGRERLLASLVSTA